MLEQQILQAIKTTAAGQPALLPHRLTALVHILRQLGLKCGTAELLDAAQALARVDLLQRSQVKYALKACLAKGPAEGQLFEAVFDTFFLPPPELARRLNQLEQQEQETRWQLKNARQELARMMENFSGGAEQVQNLTEEQVMAYAALPGPARDNFRQTMERMRANPVNDPGHLISQVLQAALNYWRYYLLKQQEQQALAGEEQPPPLPGSGQPGGLPALFYRHPQDRLYHSDLAGLAGSDPAQVRLLLQRVTRRLAAALARRYRRSRVRGALDYRRTVRASIAHGGVPLKLHYLARRRRPARLLLICDVSASMARYASFVLQFIYGLGSGLGQMDSFVFSEDLEAVGQYFRRGRDFAAAVLEAVNHSRQWGKTTNLAAALETIWKEQRELLQPDTLLLIYSDTKTVAAPAAAALLADKILRRVKKAVWLNPLPEEQWPREQTVAVFRPLLPMYECRTVAQLEKALRRVL